MILACYSREDEVVLARLWPLLASRSLDPVRDEPAVQGDAFWRRNLADELAVADGLLVIWSSSAAASPWLDEEIRSFTGPVIAVVTDPTPLSASLAVANPVRATPATLPAALASLDLPTSRTGDRWRHDVSAVRARAELTRALDDRLASLTDRLGSRRPELEPAESGPGRPLRNGRDGTALQRVLSARPRSDPSFVHLGTAPVTNECYRRFIDETGWDQPPPLTTPGFDHPHQPVVGVTWFEAQAYAAWAGGRLPTVTEWRSAARPPSTDRRFATTTGELTHDVAWFGQPLGTGAPTTVDCFPPTADGFAGLAGNTWDWCLDEVGHHRAIAGGGYADTGDFCSVRSTYRAHPVDRDAAVGFRIAIDDPRCRAETA